MSICDCDSKKKYFFTNLKISSNRTFVRWRMVASSVLVDPFLPSSEAEKMKQGCYVQQKLKAGYGRNHHKRPNRDLFTRKISFNIAKHCLNSKIWFIFYINLFQPIACGKLLKKVRYCWCGLFKATWQPW